MPSERPIPPERPTSRPLNGKVAFARVYESTHLAVYRYIYALAGGPAVLVEDLTAETYYKAWRARRSFKGDERATMRWLLRIARNLVIDFHRRQSRQEPASSLEQQTLACAGPNPEVLIELADDQATLLQALHALPERARELLILRYVLGWKVKDIGVQLGMTENTVSVALRRALDRLRRDWPRQESHAGPVFASGYEGEDDHKPGTAGPEVASQPTGRCHSQPPGGEL